MLRINLLPSYVSQRRLTRKLIAGFSALFIVCLVVPLFLYWQASHQKKVIFDQMTAAEAGKAATDALTAQAASTRSQIAPIQAKVDFVAAVHEHNQDVVNFWNTLATYSGNSKVIYSDAVVAGTTLTIKAYAPSIAEVGRYLQAMYSEPDFKSVGIDKLPGYPDAVSTKLYFNNQLMAVGSTNGTAGSTPAAAGGTAAGAPAYGTPAPVGPAALNVPTFTPKGTIVSGAPATSASAAASMTAVMVNTPAFARLRSQVNPFEDPAQQYNRIVLLLLKQMKVTREPQGFPVTITATLNQPLTSPTVPGAAAPATPVP